MAKPKHYYLVANYMAKPKNPLQTSQPGYMKNPNNIQYEEHVFLTHGLRDKDLRNNIVLDLTEEKIVKNSFSLNTTYDELFTGFYANYKEYIDKAMSVLHPVAQPEINGTVNES